MKSNNNELSFKRLTVSNLTMIGFLSTISVLLYFYEFAVPIFPEFLKIDLTDVPALIGVVFFGLPVGIFVELIKNIFHAMLLGNTGGIGEIANFIVGCAFLLPFGLVFSKIKNPKGFLFASIAGSISMTVVACIFNYYVLIPIYAKIFGTDINIFVDIAKKLNGYINNYRDFIILSIGPFNLLKAIFISLLGFLIYNPLKKYMNRIK